MGPQQVRKRLYIAGGPGGSSIAPPVHEHIAQLLGHDWTCEFLQLATANEVMEYFRAPDFAGAIITMPHKKTIIPFLHQCDELVDILGACNFVYQKDGRFCGTNTDWVGIYDAILAQSPDHILGRTGMVCGAGGASRAAIYALWAKLNCDKIYVVNRDDGEVAELFRDVHQQPDLYQPEIVHVRSITQAKELPPPYYIISAVPDIEPATTQEVASRDILVEFMSRSPAKGVLMDMCYHPPMTRILKLGIQYGYRIIQGFTVVAAQFPCQWKYWTGQEIATNEVFEMMERLLGEQEFASPTH